VKQIRKRLTYANVMSSIAVFLLLGGATAFAAGHLGKNTVGTKQLKKNAVTKAKIKKNAVTGAKVKESTLGTVPKATTATTATNATNAAHATSADSATSAANSDNLGGSPASSFQKTGDLLFATIAPAGSGAEVVRGRGVVGVESPFEGEIDVRFNRDITGCTWLATYGPPDSQFVDGLHATVRGLPDPNEILVVLYNEEEEEEDGSGVHVEALCP
jgi:hypothetical protein